LNQSMRMAAERAEMERMREAILNPKGKIHDPFKK